MENPFQRKRRCKSHAIRTWMQSLKLEHDALNRRTPTERVSDAITKLVGNVWFAIGQLFLLPHGHS